MEEDQIQLGCSCRWSLRWGRERNGPVGLAGNGKEGCFAELSWRQQSWELGLPSLTLSEVRFPRRRAWDGDFCARALGNTVRWNLWKSEGGGTGQRQKLGQTLNSAEVWPQSGVGNTPLRCPSLRQGDWLCVPPVIGCGLSPWGGRKSSSHHRHFLARGLVPFSPRQVSGEGSAVRR